MLLPLYINTRKHRPPFRSPTFKKLHIFTNSFLTSLRNTFKYLKIKLWSKTRIYYSSRILNSFDLLYTWREDKKVNKKSTSYGPIKDGFPVSMLHMNVINGDTDCFKYNIYIHINIENNRLQLLMANVLIAHKNKT